MAALTQARLKELLHYDHDTGVFAWLVKPSNNVKVGDNAGSKNFDGYLHIQIDYKKYLCSRLAFLCTNGYFPEHEVDHINGIRDDNRWCNLRHVTRLCNLQNKKPYKNNRSGYTGVYRNEKSMGWVSQIRHKGKVIYLGFHGCPLEAALHRIAAEDCMPEWHCDERCENRKKVFADLKRSILDSKLDPTL